MTFSSFAQRRLKAALAASALIAAAAISASAQEITYYNFNTPATASPTQDSYSCSTNTPSLNPPFCFNYQGTIQDPLFILDPAGGSTWATEMTSQQPSQAASMWFSTPQKVAEGFNAWFQFKITPMPAHWTADGIAFVIQNAQGGGTDPTGFCSETGSGPTVVGDLGGCIGYGGIDNSLALELDTYDNAYFGDPGADGPSTYDDNHIALQDCGAGQPNSPDHTDCLVTLAATATTPAIPTLISNPLSGTGNVVTLADGNVHDVVVVYNGPLDTPANTISVYIDPVYNPGTHTPVIGSTPIFTGPFNISQAVNLSGSLNDSAYVGFTGATGGNWETNEIMAWTFTPHTTVTEQQPLNPPGTPTTFNFGTHTYAVNLPPSAPPSGISMSVTANIISPSKFMSLLGNGPTQYSGSACQVYDDTGGNCIIYSVYCFQTGSPSDVVACPAPVSPPPDCSTNPNETNCIDLDYSFINSIPPTSPGFLQGDPLYTPVSSIVGNGTMATVTCAGECAVTPSQTVTLLDANDNPIPGFTGVTATSATLTTFTFLSTFNGTDTGGFVTSNNVKDILLSYSPQDLDGSGVSQTTNWSDFVATAVTTIGSQTQLAAPNNSDNVIQNQAEELTATVSIPTAGPTGLPLLSIESISNTVYPGTTVGGTISFSDNNGPVASCQSLPLTAITANNVTTYQAQCNYTPTTTGPDTVTAQYSGDPYHQPSSGSQTLTVSPPTVQVTVVTSPAGLIADVNGASAGSLPLTWNIGTNYTLYASSPQTLVSTPYTRYVFSSWSNGVTSTTSPTDVVPAPASATTYTALFTTQYQLSASAGAGGTVTVTNGYYNQGSAQPILATPYAGYVFSGWTGSSDIANPASASTTITMNKPETIAASFTAVPVATVSPLSINLGTLYLGSIVTKTITVSNTGAAAMTINDPLIGILPGTILGDLSEYITLNLCPKTLAPAKSCSMTVTFIAGPFYGTQAANLTINDNAAGSPQTVMLTATVINPQAVLSTGSLNFGSQNVGAASASKSITLSNPGASTLSITGIALSGTDAGDYLIASNTCGSSLTAGKSCTIGVSFKPLAKGSLPATLVVTDNAQSSSQSVSLAGSGIN